METNRYAQHKKTAAKASQTPRWDAVMPIGDVRPAPHKPAASVTPVTPIHARPARPIAHDVRPPQRAAPTPPTPATPIHQTTQHHRAPAPRQQAAPPPVEPKPAPAPPAEPAPAAAPKSISIRIRVPSTRKITVPPIVRKYPVFWALLAIAGALLFTIGYQLGHSSAKPAQPAAPVVSFVIQKGSA